MMNMVYNSESYCVLEYPALQSYEVVDKHAGRGTYFQGDVAEKFREAMTSMASEDSSTEHVDEFLEDFGVLINFPVAVH
jgi:23S rRNA A2030 N6-methylase RlmJ